jgi:hypothetical protein
MIRKLQKRIRYLLPIFFILIIIIYISGILIHPFEKDYKSEFSYPIDRKDFPEVIAALVDGDDFQINEHEPMTQINSYDYSWIISNEYKCHNENIDNSTGDTKSTTSRAYSTVNLILVIKSALDNSKNRIAIRKTWGDEQRFSDVVIKRVFILGSCDSVSNSASCQESIESENLKYRDIVQGNFIDSYYNNTIKTMMGFKWLSTYCLNAEFALFVDDDYYLSVKNLLQFLKHPLRSSDSSNVQYSPNRHPYLRLYAGHVFLTSPPMRHSTSKWFVSLQEYPFNAYPPYVTAGAYILSNRAFREISMASHYVKHFRFDDIFVGLIAKKIDLQPQHNDRFLFWPPFSYQPEAFDNVIASHGFRDTDFLKQVWSDQKVRGSA